MNIITIELYDLSYNCFITLIYNCSSLSDLANSLRKYSLGPNKFVQLLWPRLSCPLLFENQNVVLVDSPGVDIDGDFDYWIENYCMDAEIFVLVVNAESTLMMREKTFFKRVAEKVTKPNLLVLLNRYFYLLEQKNKVYFIFLGLIL